MRSVGKADDSADMIDGDIALCQHDFGFFDAPLGDVFPYRKSGLLSKALGEVGARGEGGSGDALNRKRVAQIFLDVLLRAIDDG